MNLKMESLRKLINNPIKLYLIWTIFLILIFFIVIPILNRGHSGGEQIILIYWSHSIGIALYGYFAISAISIFIFWRSGKVYWKIIMISLLLFSMFSIYKLDYEQNEEKAYRESFYKKDIIGSDELEISIEKYNIDDKVRSERFWKNGKKDSVWKFYDESGNIEEIKTYRNDSLIDSWKNTF